jgi:hypothetical protein
MTIAAKTFPEDPKIVCPLKNLISSVDKSTT